MKSFIVLLMGVFLFVGCVNLELNFPTFQTTQKVLEKNSTEVFIEKNVSIITKLLEKEVIKSDNLEEDSLILNIFHDELYFEKDKVGEDKTKVVIKYLDAFDWEKKALNRIYEKHKLLWSIKQSKDFFKILEEDKYFSLCADRRYWDNLQFEESQPERDILHSILLIRYLNNLSHGCPKWVESSSKIKNENAKEYINTKQILSLLPHNVIISKLVASYKPKSKKFSKLVQKHRKLLNLDTQDEVIKATRLELEEHKRKLSKPEYKKKRK